MDVLLDPHTWIGFITALVIACLLSLLVAAVSWWYDRRKARKRPRRALPDTAVREPIA